MFSLLMLTWLLRVAAAHSTIQSPPPRCCVCLQAAVAAKFPPAAPYAVSLFFPDGTEVDDDESVEVGGRGGGAEHTKKFTPFNKFCNP